MLNVVIKVIILIIQQLIVPHGNIELDIVLVIVQLRSNVIRALRNFLGQGQNGSMMVEAAGVFVLNATME